MKIEVHNLKKRYNAFELDIPALDIKPGEIFGLVGNNGAGKTTLLRLCLDLIESADGYIQNKACFAAGAAFAVSVMTASVLGVIVSGIGVWAAC